MKFLIIFTLTVFLSCGPSDEEKEKYNCHGADKYGNSHYLKIPFVVSPHQLTYKVGDTITLSAHFTNQIEDISYERIFKIDSVLLRPIITLRIFDSNGTTYKVSGANNILIDSIYDPYYGNSTHSYIRYKDNGYHWTAKIVLRKLGRYVFTIEDTSINSLEEHMLTSGSLNFDGRCAGSFLICNMIQGDAHMKELEPELIYIDKKIVYDNMCSLYDRNSLGVYGTGSYNWETGGTYGFIVE